MKLTYAYYADNMCAERVSLLFKLCASSLALQKYQPTCNKVIYVGCVPIFIVSTENL